MLRFRPGCWAPARAIRLGFWEPRAAVYINEAILRRHGSAGFDLTLRLQEEGAFDAEENAACIAKDQGRFSPRCRPAPLVVIKDPKITALSGMWFEGSAYGWIQRHGRDCGAPPTGGHRVVCGGRSSLAGYLECLMVEIQSAGRKRTRAACRACLAEYANFVEDWRGEVKRISAALAIDLNTLDEGAIERGTHRIFTASESEAR